jgi:SAM-dependent methyltransferase
MDPSDLTLWRESAEAWVHRQGAAGDEARRLLDPYVWDAVGPVAGCHVLDVGCGEGRFGRALAAAGARVTGLEPTLPLAARTGFSTVAGLGEALPFRSASFDLVLFYLVLVDIGRYQEAIREAARVLRPGGKLVAVNLTPISTATKEPLWERDAAGRKTARRVEFYGRWIPTSSRTRSSALTSI